ncbi:MAG: GNAT family N-acetyltransferase [Acidimicrobiia bacterium]|nr:GNAT family N-acetyltransferase [Acidimicrobiia bacterium]
MHSSIGSLGKASILHICYRENPRSARLNRVLIIEASEVTQKLVEAMATLVPQLSRSNPAPHEQALQEIIDSDATTLLLAQDENGIVGALTLVLFPIPTGIRAWIEDVVVDEKARGQGIGRSLNEAAIKRARDRGAVTIDLTSRPSRQSANRLYQQIGFTKRETAVYRLDLRDVPQESQDRV